MTSHGPASRTRRASAIAVLCSLSVCSYSLATVARSDPFELRDSPEVRAVTRVAGDDKMVELAPIPELVPYDSDGVHGGCRTMGDRDFGRGPEIEFDIRLRVGESGKNILADVFLYMREVGENDPGKRTILDTTRRGQPEDQNHFFDLEVLPSTGRKILEVDGIPVDDLSAESLRSHVVFRGVNAGAQFGAPISLDEAKFAARSIIEVVAGITEAATPELAKEAASAAEYLKSTSGDLMTLTINGNHVLTKSKVPGPVSMISVVGDTGGDDISDDVNPKDDARVIGIWFDPIRVAYAD